MYKSLKPITIKSLTEAGACEEKLRAFAQEGLLMGTHFVTDVISADDAMMVAKAIGEPTWLIEHGFVEEQRPTYHIGQRFKKEGNIYLLVGTANKRGDLYEVQLVNVKTGWPWDEPVFVASREYISEADFKKLRLGNFAHVN